MLKYLIFFLAIFSANCLSNDSLNFFAIGDWGGLGFIPYVTLTQLASAREMGIRGETEGADFVVSLGDHFYMSGVKNVEDKRFDYTFEKVYTSKSLQVPWLALGGNHDHYGNITAQVAYSKVSKRWVYPSLYYSKIFTIPGSNSTVQLVMIDTVVLCGNTRNDGSFMAVNVKEHYDQLFWLDKTLSESKTNYLFVAGHFPIYSVGSHGSTKCLIKTVLPLLQKYRVNAYLTGHDHNLQHISPKENRNWTVEHFLSGASNVIDPYRLNLHKIPPNSLRYFWGELFSLGAYSYFKISPTKAKVFYYGNHGTLLYQYSFGPRM